MSNCPGTALPHQLGVFSEERKTGARVLHTVKQKELTIGRDRSTDIRIIHKDVSRIHGLITIEDGQVSPLSPFTLKPDCGHGSSLMPAEGMPGSISS